MIEQQNANDVMRRIRGVYLLGNRAQEVHGLARQRRFDLYVGGGKKLSELGILLGTLAAKLEAAPDLITKQQLVSTHVKMDVR